MIIFKQLVEHEKHPFFQRGYFGFHKEYFCLGLFPNFSKNRSINAMIIILKETESTKVIKDDLIADNPVIKR
jgi:hypothetical protein